MPKYFDIHSHLNFKDYDADFDAVIARMRESGTHTIVVGTDYESSKRAVELAEQYPEIYACIGVHPVDDPTRAFDEAQFTELVKHPKVVAVGECGLDFYHSKKEEDYERQAKLFREQIEFAIKHRKPIMIHGRDAYEEILAILEEYRGGVFGNVHFFAGSWEVAERFFNLGFTISVTGVLTLTKQYDEVVKRAPLDKIMTETDAPFVAPVPYRGQRNAPSYVANVGERVAEIRWEDLEEVRQRLVENALRMVG